MLDWLDAIPNLGVPGVLGVPDHEKPEIPAGLQGTPARNTTFAEVFRGVPTHQAEKPGKPPVTGREHPEHAEHVAENTAKALLRDWHGKLSKLDPFAPPAGIDPARWSDLIDDACFIYEGFASTAVRDGWSVLDLFGLHSSRPGLGGLCDRLNGARNLKMDADRAVWSLMNFRESFCRGGGDDLAGVLIAVWDSAS